MADDNVLAGWPWPKLPPLEAGKVDGIAWVVATNDSLTFPCLCGYARIPWEGHPWTGCTNYHDLPIDVHGGLTYGPRAPIELGRSAQDLEDLSREIGGEPFVSRMPPDFTVPAMTFADCGGWIGFDTGHAWDVWTDEALAEAGAPRKSVPAIEQELIALRERFQVASHARHWTLVEVIDETRNLAQQIATAGKVAQPPATRPRRAHGQ